MKFGDVLRELLEERGVTQKELAKELCLAVSTIGNYANNQREPDYSVLKQIASYFQVTTDYLLNYSCEGANSDHDEMRLLHLYQSMNGDARRFFLDEAVALAKYFPSNISLMHADTGNNTGL